MEAHIRYTLLDLVQTILSDMDSDEVNSINDSVEAQQVSRIVRTQFYNIISRSDIPSQYGLFNLTSSADASKPTLMTLPSNIGHIDWLKYDGRTVDDDRLTLQDVWPLPFKDFADRMYALNTTQDNVISFSHTITVDGSTPTTVTFLGTNDKAPKYYTSFDDGTFLFDSYDADVDSTLQTSKTQGFGEQRAPWSNSDVFVPPLNDDQFQLLLNEATNVAFAKLKQTVEPMSNRDAKRSWVTLQRKKTQIPLRTELSKQVNYGRK